MYGWEFPPHITGGLGVACHGIIQSLLENQIEVALVLPGFAVPTLLFPDTEMLQVLPTPFLYGMISPYGANTVQRDKLTSDTSITETHHGDLFSAVEDYARAAGSFAKTTPHDVIHVHDWLTVLAGIAARKISHKPLVFHVHSLEISRSADPVNSAIFNIEKYGLEQADAIIAVSEFTKQRIVHYYHIPAHKVTVVYNGLFKEQISKPFKEPLKEPLYPDYKTVLFLGRMTHQKGPFHFVDAAHKVLRTRDDVQFVMAGDGDLFHSVVERVAQLQLGRHIHFTQFLERDQVELIYAKSQMYVMPSVAEPFGLTCLEALAQHVPVILSKQSGVSEVIQNVLKVDFWDIDEMAAKINALLDFPALGRQLTENALPELEQLLWSKTANKIFNVYGKLTGT